MRLETANGTVTTRSRAPYLIVQEQWKSGARIVGYGRVWGRTLQRATAINAAVYDTRSGECVRPTAPPSDRVEGR